MALLSQLPMTFLLNLLTANPNTGYFAFNTTDYPYASYPQGIPRSILLTAFQNAAVGSQYSADGAWATQVYAPGILKNGGAPVGGGPTLKYPKNASQDYQTQGEGLSASSLPVALPGRFNTGNLSDTVTGEFSPEGCISDVPTAVITPTVTPEAAFAGAVDVIFQPNQVL